MTGQSGPDEPDEPGTAASPPIPGTITWRPTAVPDLLEARLVAGNGAADGLYVGYIVRRAGDGEDEWHGYIGIEHVLLAVGSREAVQAAVEQAAREAWTTRRQGRAEGGTGRV